MLWLGPSLVDMMLLLYTLSLASATARSKQNKGKLDSTKVQTLGAISERIIK